MLKKKVTGQLRKFLILTGAFVVGFFVSVLLHNLISGLFGKEEPFFFLIATIICPIGFLVGVTVSLILLTRQKNEPHQSI